MFRWNPFLAYLANTTSRSGFIWTNLIFKPWLLGLILCSLQGRSTLNNFYMISHWLFFNAVHVQWISLRNVRDPADEDRLKVDTCTGIKMYHKHTSFCVTDVEISDVPAQRLVIGLNKIFQAEQDFIKPLNRCLCHSCPHVSVLKGHFNCNNWVE